jgi:formylglycine-generating enzyme required for sulfatase activity
MIRRRLAALALLGGGLLLLGARSSALFAPDSCLAVDGRVLVPAGTVLLGEDGPSNPGSAVTVAAFRIDRHEVTNRQFAAFVSATGWITRAEREGGSAVFVPPSGPVDMDDASQWWRYVKGADWRHPYGPASSVDGREDYPVVQVDQADAKAYARWAGAELPDTRQWERAARGNQSRPVAPVAWAYETKADGGGAGRPLANTWQGVFPVRDTGEDGRIGLAPVGCFDANSFGLYDMVGNAWEWTSDEAAGAGGGNDGRRGIIKGGSYLCAMNYCANFRPAAWQAADRDLGTSHIGFRTIVPVARAVRD